MLLIVISVLLLGYIILIAILVDYYAYKRKEYRNITKKYQKKEVVDSEKETENND